MAFPLFIHCGRRASSRAIGRSQNGGRSLTRARYVNLEIEELEARCLLDGNPAVVPAPPDHISLAVSLLEAPRGNPQVVFMGDSITEFFGDGVGASVWNSQIAPLNAADYGVAGNTTGNVLWQIENGQLAGIHPSVIVLMIGFNNLDFGLTPKETAQGVAADVQAIQMAQPQAHILLLGILPSGASPFDPLRPAIAETNQMISALAAPPNVSYLDFGSSFLLPNGSYNSTLTIDYIHPSAMGYAVEANAILPTINLLLQWTADQNYITGLYRDLLGRPVDQQGLSYWIDALYSMRSYYFSLYFYGQGLDYNTAGTLANQVAEMAVVEGIESSAAFQARPQPTGTAQQIVNQDYLLLLGRPADSASQVYVQQLELGVSNDMILALIASDPGQEYANKTSAG